MLLRPGGLSRSSLRRPLRRRGATEPGVDQVDLFRRQVEPLRTAARDNEVAEAAGEEVRRRALLEPRIRLAHDLEHEAHVVATHVETHLASTLADVDQRLLTRRLLVEISSAITSNSTRYSGGDSGGAWQAS